jgi:hypothetical protein
MLATREISRRIAVRNGSEFDFFLALYMSRGATKVLTRWVALSSARVAQFAFRIGYTILLFGLLQEPHAGLRSFYYPFD